MSMKKLLHLGGWEGIEPSNLFLDTHFECGFRRMALFRFP